VKTEFGKFGEVLSKVKTQTETVLKSLEGAEQRSRVMTRALKQVEALPEVESTRLIPLDKEFD
jgi:DNA recombination protein RmuC